MSSEFGNALKVSVFGQSHGKAIGVTVDGLPSGEAIDLEALQAFLDRRRPGTSELTTARNEADRPEFLAGVTEDSDGVTTVKDVATSLASTRRTIPTSSTNPAPLTRTTPHL